MPSPASPLSPDAQQAAALIPPDDIEARSFAIIDGEIPEPRPFTGYAWEVARRLVHTSGDISLPGDLYLPDESVCGGVQALRRGCAIFTDTRMACSGIPARRLAPLNSSVQCLLDLPGVADRARTDRIAHPAAITGRGPARTSPDHRHARGLCERRRIQGTAGAQRTPLPRAARTQGRLPARRRDGQRPGRYCGAQACRGDITTFASPKSSFRRSERDVKCKTFNVVCL